MGRHDRTATFNADVYAFAIHTMTRHEEYRPLDIAQWDFYVVAYARLAQSIWLTGRQDG